MVYVVGFLIMLSVFGYLYSTDKPPKIRRPVRMTRQDVEFTLWLNEQRNK